MPLYEYRCRRCGHRFEVLQRLGEGAEGLACPRCGEVDAERQLSTFAAGASEARGAATTAPVCSGFT